MNTMSVMETICTYITYLLIMTNGYYYKKRKICKLHLASAEDPCTTFSNFHNAFYQPTGMLLNWPLAGMYRTSALG